ncbi:MAG TPA: rhomboid family intramembrane serine protease [Flavobacteriales bacterium]|nr:rhomboid family intramembrane serine protease [Flavobacteriales bacterium]
MQALSEQPLIGQGPAPRERKLAYSIVPPALIVLVLWCVFLLDRVYVLDLARWGILPRTLHGLWGVLFSPFIHGDMEHLLNNSIPLLVLGSALLYFFPRLTGRVVLASWVISGTWVWISARDNYHIGASGVVYGIAAFLFTSGLLRKQRTLMGLSLLVVFLYGGLIWGVFPIVPRISWESHFWGAASGVIMAFLYRHVPAAVRDPQPVVWDDEDSDDPLPTGPLVDADPSSGEGDVQGDRSWRSSDSWNNGGPEEQKPLPPGG